MMVLYIHASFKNKIVPKTRRTTLKTAKSTSFASTAPFMEQAINSAQKSTVGNVCGRLREASQRSVRNSSGRCAMATQRKINTGIPWLGPMMLANWILCIRMYVRHVCSSISIGAINGLAETYVVFLLSKDKYLPIRERPYFTQVNYVYTSSVSYIWLDIKQIKETFLEWL